MMFLLPSLQCSFLFNLLSLLYLLLVPLRSSLLLFPLLIPLPISDSLLLLFCSIVLVYLFLPPSAMDTCSSVRRGHQMARLRVPQSSPSSSSSLPPSGQKDPARPSVRSAPSVPTMVSTSSRSGVPAPTAFKYLRTSKHLSTPSPVAPRTTSSHSSIPTPVSRSSIPTPAPRSPVAKATSTPSPRPLSAGASFLKRFDEKHPTSTRSIPVPVARSPVAPRTTSSPSAPQKTSANGHSATSPRSSPSVAPRTTSSPSSSSLSAGASFLKRFDEKHPTHTRSSIPAPASRSSVAPKATSTRSSIPTPSSRSPVAPRTTSSPSVAQATSIPSPRPLSAGVSFLKRFDEKHPSTRSPVDLRTTSIPSPVAPRTTSTPSGASRPSRLQALREAYHRSREARARSDAALASTEDGAASAAKSAARKGKSVKSVQFSEVTTVITVNRWIIKARDIHRCCW
ncbi:uncharacterized protein AKAW2_70499S [Aspergillus luchuensis]|uniref:Uncharacterized protein n=2 Tax=Aspergillus kawachii TaxID=1069201 RepID=A0A7R7WIU5_ASPKA|nr:uncharacterized protein AKAW2_70499S [Aspergillus luchuensis]BCS03621.1 hypothetical protein AKAW2_70499S [Aspergillus luchuensis]